MPRIRSSTRHVVSRSYAPSDACAEVFYSVMRAGHVQAGPEHHFERESHPGHEIILCLKGRGFARLRGKLYALDPGNVVWINRHHPHAYWADPQQPWELYWMLFDGPRLEPIWRMFLASGGPVVGDCDARHQQSIFRRIFKLLHHPQASTPILVHAEMAQLLALLFYPLRTPLDSKPKEVPSNLRKAFERMRIYHHLPLRVAELAALSEMSESHFIRTFRAAIGTSPIDWLRRERIAHAQRRLAETDDSMKQIARQVGYNDQFYFSRDFKRLTNVTPSDYRERGTLRR